MIKTLMHKDTPVAKLRLSSNGSLQEVMQIMEEELLPENNGDEKRSLERWLLLRKISVMRQEIAPLNSFYGDKMFVSTNMRSLFDTYWLKSSDEETWEEINAFDNWDPLEDDIFLATLYPKDFEGPSYDSPNLTTPGILSRFWYYDEEHPLGLLCMNAQQSMREYNTAKEMKLDIICPRSYMILGGYLFTYQPTRTSKDIESISFDVLFNKTEDPKLSTKDNLQKCCETYKIPNWQDFIFNVVDFDNAMGITDRKMDDFKVLRDTETLKILGFDRF